MLKSPTRKASWQHHHQQEQPETSKSTFVERLLICYPDLPALCGGKIDESSSLAELTESILYFYNGSDSEAPSSEAAVQFMGLCSALYNFPTTVGESKDPAQHVHFGNSTLVFAPLEGDRILAFVQVTKGSSALAIRSSIQQSHDMFRLLRKGGILPRLSSRDHVPKSDASSCDQHYVFNYSFADNNSAGSGDDDDMPPDMSNDNLSTDTGSLDKMLYDDDEQDAFVDDGCIYPGMKTLYELRKDIRKMQRGMSKIRSSLLEIKRSTLRDDLNEAGIKLFDLLQALPISSLREDLKNHYDEYLADPSRSNHCLTETIPRPMMTCNDCSIPTTSAHLSHAMRTLLKGTFHSRNKADPLLVAISSFHKGRLLFTRTLGNDDSLIGIDNATACHIMRYMTHFAHRMQHQPNNRLPSRRRTIDRMRLNVKESLQQLSFHKNSAADEEQSKSIPRGTFMPSPPLSLLNISDELSEVSTSALGNVWTPIFYVLVDGQRVPAHVALFSVQHYTFLLHIDAGALDLSPLDLLQMSTSSSSFADYFCTDATAALSTPSKEQEEADEEEAHDENPIEKLLISLSMQLSESVNRAEQSAVKDEDDDDGDDDDSSTFTATVSYQPEVGVDIIFVDRELQHVVLQLSEKAKRSMSGVGGVGSHRIRVDHEHDVRHVLQSRLPLEAIRALNDMMGEIQEHDNASGASEFCTYLQPSGWIWAGSSHGNVDEDRAKELYLLFDANEHGTIGDVEAIANRLRQNYLDEHEQSL